MPRVEFTTVHEQFTYFPPPPDAKVSVLIKIESLKIANTVCNTTIEAQSSLQTL
jgi:hypothetical protein